MFGLKSGGSSLFSGSGTPKVAVTDKKDIVFRLMSESPKANLHYGSVRDVLKKPLRFSHLLPECTCTVKRSCYTCFRLGSLRGRGPFDITGISNHSPDISKLNQPPHISSTEGANSDPHVSSSGESSEDEEGSRVVDVLRLLFHEADEDAKRNARSCIGLYRKDLVAQQEKRFAAVSTDISALDSVVLSEFTERKHKLELELSNAEKSGDDLVASGQVSPVSAMIRQLERHRLGSDNDFLNKIDAVRVVSAKSNELEKHRAELALALGKLKMVEKRAAELREFPNLRDNLMQIRKSVEGKSSQMSIINVDTVRVNDVVALIADISRFVEEHDRMIDDYEAALKIAQSVPQATAPQSIPLAAVPVPLVQSLSGDESQSTAAADARKFVDDWRARLKPLLEDPAWKPQRSELQRAVFSLVNMLSSESSSSSVVSVNLNRLLDGQPVEISGRNVSSSFHQLGTGFVKLAISKKLIGQAEEEISSQPSIAPTIATAALQLIATRPDLSTLVLSHLYNACPMLIPISLSMDTANLNADQILEQLGYKRRPDGEYEGIERFLKRMTGVVRLFGAIAVASEQLPDDVNRPITLSKVWSLVVRLLKQPPFPDLTATVIYELLKNCSKQLHAAYGRQFDKLAQILKGDFLQRLEASSATAATLRHFVNTEVAAICNWPLPQK